MDDATTGRFQAEVGLTLPEAGIDRFKRRAELLVGPERQRWIAWRQAELTAFYRELAKRISARGGAPDDASGVTPVSNRQLVLCTENLFAGAEASQRLRQSLSGRASIDDAAAEIGVDLASLAAAPGVCLLRPRQLASDEELDARAVDIVLNGSPELDEAVAGQPAAGELIFYGARRVRLPSFDAQSPFGAEKTFLSLAVPGFPAGHAANRSLAAALAARDFYMLVEGAELLPLVQSSEATRLRQLLQELPADNAEVRVERRQPVTMRVYRTADATTVCLINESPWSVNVPVAVDSTEPAAWRDLGSDSLGGDPATPSADAAQLSGQLAGPETWQIALPPYGIVARQYTTRNLRIGPLAPTPVAEASAELADRIAAIEGRMRGLDAERPYLLLENPDFELVGAGGLMVGWQSRIGKSGAVAIDQSVAENGSRSLHLRSDDALGVAAQSNQFPMPSTGQLTIRARVHATGMTPSSCIYARIEYEAGGKTWPRFAPFSTHPFGDEWVECEFAVDDLPLGESGSMRVMFHLAGRGEAWIDGVQLFDLRFTNSQRMDLVKRLYAAKTARDEGQLVDCQRLIDGYWPRYVLEHVPAATPPALGSPAAVGIATRPGDAPPRSDDDNGVAPTAPGASASTESSGDAATETPGLGERFRGALPHILRR